MSPRGRSISGVAALLVLAGAVAYFVKEERSKPTEAASVQTPLEEASANLPIAPSLPLQIPDSTDDSPRSPLLTAIHRALDQLTAGRNPAALARLREELIGSDPSQAIAAIVEFIATGRDAETGEDFTPGEGGLAAAPTLRVFLMDLLGTLSKKARTADAAKIGRTVLGEKQSADEWAISLRNVAWHEPQSTAFLAGKFADMVAHRPWLDKPSAGMLEAFDVAVFSKDVRALPALSKLVQGEEESLQRAAAIALDRLSEAAPLEVMTQLNANPALMSERPFVRADYFSKADLSQTAQRHAVEQYLSRGDVTLPEKSKFLKASAAPTTFISDNLLTTSAPPPDDTARRQALAAATADWMKMGRFPELQPEITQLHRRLTGG